MERVQQISVFAENKPGKIERITEVLTGEKTNIRAITIASNNGYGVIKLLVDNPEKAFQALKDKGLSAALNHVLAVEIEDRPGGLHKVAQVIKKHKINVEDAYGFVIESGKRAVLILEVKDIEGAENTLLSENIHLLNEKDLYEL
ncbi:MAG: ACT domain-containing protein [Candidatus Aerophobetes bacterium]|nr:ACT domain-containing protein [Candidatus Aerophobetes bacterium]